MYTNLFVSTSDVMLAPYTRTQTNKQNEHIYIYILQYALLSLLSFPILGRDGWMELSVFTKQETGKLQQKQKMTLFSTFVERARVSGKKSSFE